LPGKGKARQVRALWHRKMGEERAVDLGSTKGNKGEERGKRRSAQVEKKVGGKGNGRAERRAR